MKDKKTEDKKTELIKKLKFIILEKKDLNYETIAKILNLNYSTLSRKLNNKKDFKLNELLELEKILNIEIIKNI